MRTIRQRVICTESRALRTDNVYPTWRSSEDMKVLITGGSGMVGTAITEHADRFDNEHEFVILDRNEHPECETYVADVADYDAIRPAFDDVDAVIHLAVYAEGFYDANWERIVDINIRGTYNTLAAANDAGVKQVIFGSTNHVVGMYELDHKPEIYEDAQFTVDHTDPVRPDSLYGVSKLLGENMGRLFVERDEYPKQFYGLRICSLRWEEWDHPYGDAELGVQEGRCERGSTEYEQAVNRMKAMWLSRRDCAQLVECALQDDTVTFDVFYGLSDNDQTWFDLEHAKNVLGYQPQDNAAQWDAPP